MSLEHSLNSSSLLSNGRLLPWQLRVRPVLSAIVGSIVAILVTVGGLIAVRRLIGALNAELPPSAMLMLALSSAALVAFARIAWRRNFPIETPGDLTAVDRVIGWGSSTGLACLAVGCCYPAYRTVDWLIWLPILVADQIWRQNFFDAGEPWSSTDDNELVTPLTAPTPPAGGYEPLDESIVQQLFRVRDDSALETVYGTVGADFVAGQRVSVVHVGFCPPLDYLPEIEAEALPGTIAKIKVVQALAHGVRLDVRLPQVAEADCRIWIDMAARPAEMTLQPEQS